MADRSNLRYSLVQRIQTALLSAPASSLRRVAGPALHNDEGWQLDLPTQVLASFEHRYAPPVTLSSPVGPMRRQANMVMPIGMPRRTDVSAIGRRIPGPAGQIDVRIYRPLDARGVLPAVVFFHGGGWVIGNIDTHDGSARYVAAQSECVVISVDYRLAPEHPFPAAPEDCIAAYAWVCDHATQLEIDPGRIAVMGDSAGGNLAAVVAQQATVRELPAPIAQCLVYPVCDVAFDTDSYREFEAGFVLSRTLMEYFRTAYSPDPSTWNDPLLAPYRATDVGGLAPALVYTAGFDPLRDEGRAYATRLKEAGVSVTERCYHDRVHGFFGMGIFPGVLDIVDEICRDLSASLRA